MKTYGSRQDGWTGARRERRPSYVRSNAGRNRATAERGAADYRTRFIKTKNTLGRAATNRGMAKRSRFAGKLEIATELDDLFGDLPPMPRKWQPKYRSYFDDLSEDWPALTPRDRSEFLRMAYDEIRYDDWDSWRESEEAEDRWEQEHGYRYQYGYEDTWSYAEERELQPTEEGWADLWVNGEVATDYDTGADRDAYWWTSDEDWCVWNDDDYEFPGEAEYLGSQQLPREPELQADVDRVKERQRAGDRYYRQHHRTVRPRLAA